MSAPTVVPALTRPRKPRKLTVVDETVGNGLRVVAVRKPGVPLVEVRLRMPFLSNRAKHPARASLLADSLLTGTTTRSRTDLAETLQDLGADLNAGADADRLLLSGNALASNLRALLDVMADVLVNPAYAKDDVAGERDRLVERLSIARSRAGVIAAEALARRMWGEHPYAIDLPQPDEVASTTAAHIRALHNSMVRPDGAVIVVVGDISPNRVVDQVGAALQHWTGAPDPQRVPALPEPSPGPLVVVDRPGSVQSSIRLGGAALRRDDPDYPALQLANLVFGGYFSSRWMENLREDKGYTYGVHSRIEHHALGSYLQLDAEVRIEVTAPSVLETRYELGRIASLPITQAELDSARQYAIGTLALSTATQAGLASMLTALSGVGLDIEWLTEHPLRLAALDVDEVSAAANRFFSPARLVELVVGDASAFTEPLRALGPITTDA
jgi:predicted Zn-dependent peptidase